ncbi:MAG: S4 domain-containing protein [Hyphomonadaceae bacterium]
MNPPRQRIDLWLFRARFAKTRADAARLVAEGGLRLVRGQVARRLEKPSADVEVGDAMVLPHRGGLRALRVLALPRRRGPAAEARALYAEVDADALA